MINISEVKEGYLIHENNGEFVLCKIIEKYDSKEEAIKELINKLNEKGI